MEIVRGTLIKATLSESSFGVHNQSKYYREIEIGERILTNILIDDLNLEKEIEKCLGCDVEVFIAPYKPYHSKLELILIRIIGD